VQVVSEVLCLARIPEVVKRLAREKEEIFVRLQGERRPVAMPGVAKLLDVLQKHGVRSQIESLM
jgi:CMP-2-keto-3-deoxyoctulosonic acid synthetase